MSLVLKLIVVLDFIFLFLYLVYTDPVRENLWGRDSGPIRDSPIQARRPSTFRFCNVILSASLLCYPLRNTSHVIVRKQ